MNSMRSYWKLLAASAGAGLLFTNCTIKTASDSGSAGSGDGSCTVGSKHSGCSCPGNAIGSQTCQADGTYSSCECPDSTSGGASSNGGAPTSGGAATTAGYGGVATTVGGAGGYSGANTEAGAGGASECSSGISTADDCVDCLAKACAAQWAACEAEDEGHVDPATGDYCLKNNPQADDGQMDSILNCIAMEQGKPGTTVVKRDVVRACGSSIGTNPDPTTQFIWAPAQMTAATKNLMNCMADAPSAAVPGAWADSNDPASFAQDPDGGLPTPLPWADCTCAKTSCTTPL